MTQLSFKTRMVPLKRDNNNKKKTLALLTFMTTHPSVYFPSRKIHQKRADPPSSKVF